MKYGPEINTECGNYAVRVLCHTNLNVPSEAAELFSVAAFTPHIKQSHYYCSRRYACRALLQCRGLFFSSTHRNCIYTKYSHTKEL